MRLTTKQLTIFAIAMLILLIIDVSFFNSGGLFFLIVGLTLLYFSYKNKRKIFVIAACIFLLFSLMTLWSIRLIPIAVLIYFLYVFMTKKQEPFEFEKDQSNELIGEYETSKEYKWQDIQLQKIMGNITIDTTETILPPGRSYIHIQQGLGKTTIYVPYEVNIELHVQTLYSAVTFLQNKPKQIWNGRVKKQDGSNDAKRTIVIVATTVLSDVEVVRR